MRAGGALDAETDNTEIDLVLKHAKKIPGPFSTDLYPLR